MRPIRHSGGVRSPDLGSQLVEVFRTALLSRSTAKSAKDHALDTERRALAGISLFKVPDKPFVTPEDISTDDMNHLARASINAHLQKVQAEQLGSYSHQSLLDLNLQTTDKFMGKKILVRVIKPQPNSIFIVMKDRRTGQRYISSTRAKKVNGSVKHIDLNQNLLVIKPSASVKIMNRSILEYLAYVVDPKDAEPLLKLSIDHRGTRSEGK